MTADLASDAAADSVEGHYAGIVSRAAAFFIDVVVIVTLFSLAGRVIEFLVSSVSGNQFTFEQVPVVSDVALAVWAFVYCAYPLAMSGRTLGMAILGLRAVRQDGSDLDGRHAALRVIAFPLSFLLFFAGFIMILVNRNRRALHDVIAGTSVVYSRQLGAQPTHFLEKQRY